jgi:hypothetical protein
VWLTRQGEAAVEPRMSRQHCFGRKGEARHIRICMLCGLLGQGKQQLGLHILGSTALAGREKPPPNEDVSGLFTRIIKCSVSFASTPHTLVGAVFPFIWWTTYPSHIFVHITFFSLSSSVDFAVICESDSQLIARCCHTLLLFTGSRSIIEIATGL